MELTMIRSRLPSSILVALAGAAALLSGPASGGELRLNMDQVRLITLKVPFKTVSIGNSLIADATMVDEHHVLLFAKEFGTTNLIAVDDEGNLVAQEQITVTTQVGHTVTLQRGPRWSTLTCNAERCDVRPTPGDEPTRYQEETAQINLRETQNLGAAAAE
jgi:hypothetical protein